MAKRSRRRAGRPRGRPRLSGISIGALQAEIERRRAKSGALYRLRDRLLHRLGQIESRIEEAGGELMDAVRGRRRGGGGRRAGGRGRAKNTGSLVDALQRTLRNKTMSVTDAAAAVQREGYKTTSKTFRTIVNQALLKHKDKFRKVSRGQYTAA